MFSNFAGEGLAINDHTTFGSQNSKGVVYHNDFINNFSAQYNSGGYGIGVYGDSQWEESCELGTEDAVFIEDNSFEGNKHAIASNNNSKYIFRYNKVVQSKKGANYTMADTHGHSKKSTSKVGSRSFEIYNNNFSTNFKDGSAYAAIGIRGGDGVIFNNKISSEKIIRTVSLLLEDASFCFKKENLKCSTKSLFIWDNEYNKKYEKWNMFHNKTTGITLENGICNECPTKIKKEKHYFLNKLKSYKPYIYPHPLRIKTL